MIKVYFSYPTILPQGEVLDHLCNTIPNNMQNKLHSFKKSENKKLYAASVLLIRNALDKNGYKEISLNMLNYSEYGRPYFKDCLFDFNISHTDNCAVLAFSENCRVGIDVEKIKEIDFSDFENFFSKNEWNKIYSSDDQERTFFNYWTLLESAIKADGRGLSLLSSKNIEIINDKVIIDQREWFSVHKNFDPLISCCITSNNKIEAVELIEVQTI